MDCFQNTAHRDVRHPAGAKTFQNRPPAPCLLVTWAGVVEVVVGQVAAVAGCCAASAGRPQSASWEAVGSSTRLAPQQWSSNHLNTFTLTFWTLLPSNHPRSLDEWRLAITDQLRGWSFQPTTKCAYASQETYYDNDYDNIHPIWKAIRKRQKDWKMPVMRSPFGVLSCVTVEISFNPSGVPDFDNQFGSICGWRHPQIANKHGCGTKLSQFSPLLGDMRFTHFKPTFGYIPVAGYIPVVAYLRIVYTYIHYLHTDILTYMTGCNLLVESWLVTSKWTLRLTPRGQHLASKSKTQCWVYLAIFFSG